MSQSKGNAQAPQGAMKSGGSATVATLRSETAEGVMFGNYGGLLMLAR